MGKPAGRHPRHPAEEVAETIEVTGRRSRSAGFERRGNECVRSSLSRGWNSPIPSFRVREPSASALSSFVAAEVRWCLKPTAPTTKHAERYGSSLRITSPSSRLGRPDIRLPRGVFALSYIEDELLGDAGSHVRQVLELAMVANPVHWQNFYAGGESQQSFARKFSRSDRSRYYWAVAWYVKP